RRQNAETASRSIETWELIPPIIPPRVWGSNNRRPGWTAKFGSASCCSVGPTCAAAAYLPHTVTGRPTLLNCCAGAVTNKTGRFLRRVPEGMRRGDDVLVAILLICVLLPTSRALAQRSDSGRLAFVSRCAGCHGSDGKGGELGPAIAARVPSRTDEDLTSLFQQGLPPS